MDIKRKIGSYSEKNVKFTNHFDDRSEQRQLTREIIKKWIFKINRLLYAEFQEEKKTWKLIYDFTSKYRLVIIVAFNSRIRIVSAYKTSKKIEKLMKKFKGEAVFISKRILKYSRWK